MHIKCWVFFTSKYWWNRPIVRKKLLCHSRFYRFCFNVKAFLVCVRFDWKERERWISTNISYSVSLWLHFSLAFKPWHLIDSGEGVSGFVTDFIFFITISLNLRCVNILQLAHRNMIYDFNLDQRINLKLYLNVKVYKN